MAMKTYFHDPWNSSLVRVRFQITWPWNLMIRVLWHIKVNFGYSWIFMPWKPADFHDPLISGLDHHQLCMAIKTFFMSHEIIFMKIKWVSMRLWILENAIFMPLAWKKRFMGFPFVFHGIFMKLHLVVYVNCWMLLSNTIINFLHVCTMKWSNTMADVLLRYISNFRNLGAWRKFISSCGN